MALPPRFPQAPTHDAPSSCSSSPRRLDSAWLLALPPLPLLDSLAAALAPAAAALRRLASAAAAAAARQIASSPLLGICVAALGCVAVSLVLLQVGFALGLVRRPAFSLLMAPQEGGEFATIPACSASEEGEEAMG